MAGHAAKTLPVTFGPMVQPPSGRRWKPPATKPPPSTSMLVPVTPCARKTSKPGANAVEAIFDSRHSHPLSG